MRSLSLGTPVKETKFTRFAGVGDQAVVSYFRNSLHNLITSVTARVFMRKTSEGWEEITTNRHEPGEYLIKTRRFIDAVRKELDSTTAPLTTENFISRYRGRKMKVYTAAALSLETDPLCKKDRNCKVFLKKEKDIRSLKPDAIPRAITFPDPRYGLEFGKYIKSIEHETFMTIDRVFGSRTVMKGMNYLQVGQEIQKKWERFDHPVSIDGDVSRLDSSISDEGQRFSHEISSYFFDRPEREEFLKLAKLQISPKVKGRADDGIISYTGTGLASGQQNTSLMGVTIVCSILYMIKTTYNLDIEVINCGDDFSVVGERGTIKTFQNVAASSFKKYNMVLKLEPFNFELEGVNFCQSNPVQVAGLYRMVRTPHTSIIKDSTCIDDLFNLTLITKWLYAVSCTGIATHGGVPIFQELYKCYGRSAHLLRAGLRSRSAKKKSYRVDLKDSSMVYWGKGLECKYEAEISDDTRWSFYLAFGIDPSTQLQLEEYYSKLTIRNEITTEFVGDLDAFW